MPAALPYRSFFELLIPPPYCFSFRTEGLDGRFGLGMCAKDGEYNFFHFDYNLGFNTRRRGPRSTDILPLTVNSLFPLSVRSSETTILIS